MSWIPVRSTFIRAFNYDEGSRTLVVEMKTGEMYAYGGVPPEVSEAWRNEAHDGGAYFSRHVRHRYAEVALPGKGPEA